MKSTSFDLAVAAALAALDLNHLPAGLCALGKTVGLAPQLRCGTGWVDYIFMSDGGVAMVAITDHRGTKSWPLHGISSTPRAEVLTRIGATEPAWTPEYEAYRAERAEMRFSAMDFYTWELNQNAPTTI